MDVLLPHVRCLMIPPPEGPLEARWPRVCGTALGIFPVPDSGGSYGLRLLARIRLAEILIDPLEEHGVHGDDEVKALVHAHVRHRLVHNLLDSRLSMAPTMFSREASTCRPRSSIPATRLSSSCWKLSRGIFPLSYPLTGGVWVPYRSL